MKDLFWGWNKMLRGGLQGLVPEPVIFLMQITLVCGATVWNLIVNGEEDNEWLQEDINRLVKVVVTSQMKTNVLHLVS